MTNLVFTWKVNKKITFLKLCWIWSVDFTIYWCTSGPTGRTSPELFKILKLVRWHLFYAVEKVEIAYFNFLSLHFVKLWWKKVLFINVFFIFPPKTQNSICTKVSIIFIKLVDWTSAVEIPVFDGTIQANRQSHLLLNVNKVLELKISVLSKYLHKKHQYLLFIKDNAKYSVYRVKQEVTSTS